jgi:hypothetical protein
VRLGDLFVVRCRLRVHSAAEQQVCSGVQTEILWCGWKTYVYWGVDGDLKCVWRQVCSGVQPESL